VKRNRSGRGAGSGKKQRGNAPDFLTAAVQHYQAGNFAEAQDLCRKCLKLERNNPSAFHLLGVISHQTGDRSKAIELISKSLKLAPDNAEALNYLGIVLIEDGKLDEAEQMFRRAVSVFPNFPEAYNNLGNVLKSLGQYDQSIVAYRAALTLRPDYAIAHNNAGSSLKEVRQFEDALKSLTKAISLNPDYAEAHYNMGNVLCDLGRIEEAITSYTTSLRLNPGYAEAHDNLGSALRDLGRFEEALTNFREAISLKPDYAKAHNGLGLALNSMGRLDEAIVSYRQALILNPDFAETHCNLASTLSSLGQQDEAIAGYRKALAIRPGFIGAHSNLLFSLQYAAGITLRKLWEEHCLWWDAHGNDAYLKKQYDTIDYEPDRPLRIGLVSADFGHHPVGFLAVKLLENSYPDNLQFFCYSNRVKADDYTRRFKEACTQWLDTHGYSNHKLAQEIQNDKIDILIDLAGHTASNRLPVFIEKPAPIQISWGGYVGTTGLPTIDYIIADAFHILEGEEKYYVEKVLRLPGSIWCYDPPVDAPPVGPLPATQNGYITFGSFNNAAKINPEMLEIWSQVLKSVPGSRIFLKYGGMDSPFNRERILSDFGKHGIDEGRVILEGKSSFSELLDCYNRVDIALDTLPYSGGVTTCEALFMGVPVVTCPGRTQPGRHSISHLNVIGFPQAIAGDFDDYVNIAKALAEDLDKLEDYRAGMRVRLTSSSLCDGPHFAENFHNLIRKAWHSFVDGIENADT
jgi:protein O-GlcNAc transferase